MREKKLYRINHTYEDDPTKRKHTIIFAGYDAPDAVARFYEYMKTKGDKYNYHQVRIVDNVKEEREFV